MLVSEWLQTSAADVMIKDVITLKASDCLSDAAEVFMQFRISGAPVVDEIGRCVGVLSMTDLIRADGEVAEMQEQAADEFFAHNDLMLPNSVYEEKIIEVRDKLTPTSEQPIERFMVTDIISVTGNDPIEKVVRYVVESRVHRVLVIDSNRKLEGIISTIDVISSLLRLPA